MTLCTRHILYSTEHGAHETDSPSYAGATVDILEIFSIAGQICLTSPVPLRQQNMTIAQHHPCSTVMHENQCADFSHYARLKAQSKGNSSLQNHIFAPMEMWCCLNGRCKQLGCSDPSWHRLCLTRFCHLLDQSTGPCGHMLLLEQQISAA